jgi:hypothetical protein
MNSQLTPTALKSYLAAPAAVQKAFDKQTNLLVENMRHPSYFLIRHDTYIITDIISHPK